MAGSAFETGATATGRLKSFERGVVDQLRSSAVRNFRLLATTVFCVSTLALTACGDDSTTNTTAAAPSATAAATGAPAASETSAAAGAAAPDKEICEAAVKSTTDFQKMMTEALTSGKEIGDADVKQAWSSMATGLSIAEGGTSDVAKTAQAYAVELKKAAASADTTAAGEAPSFGKAGTDFDTACAAAGVETTIS
ncbi:hypothetical protein ACIA8K_13640 [Catenuloplanes sp. NPDC051500]|uniref:hypothetical protein n=1 Tax=Catenuloplanes sp. NPDC051500 TaxID=3363959 RepID=UPI0037A0BB5C